MQGKPQVKADKYEGDQVLKKAYSHYRPKNAESSPNTGMNRFEQSVMFRERLKVINNELDKHLLKVDKTTILHQLKNIKKDSSGFELPVIHERSKSLMNNH